MLHALQGDASIRKVSEIEFRENETNFLFCNSWTESQRNDKKFFKKQVTVAQDNLYNKKIPTWASDFDLLAQVVALQSQQREAGECFCNKGTRSRATTGVTSTACQCQVRETLAEQDARIVLEKKALDNKVKEMIKEKQLRGLKQKFDAKAKK